MNGKGRRVAGRIVVDERIMAGKPIVSGTRISVESIMRSLAEGITVKELLEEHPSLKEADVKAALEYAAQLLANEEIMPKVRAYA